MTGIQSLKEFDISSFNTNIRPFYLGALFECLSPGSARILFEDLYFYTRPHPIAMVHAGQSLLRFSSPESANRFAVELYRTRPLETERQLHWVKNNGTIRNWQFRRYESEDLTTLFFPAIGQFIQLDLPI